MSEPIIIAIDGPASAGKSTVAKKLAEILKMRYLDSGALYRAAAFLAHSYGLESGHGAETAEALKKHTIEFGSGWPPSILLDGKDISGQIRTPEISQLASDLSKSAPVRKVIDSIQNHYVKEKNVVVEGRDATTKIAPEAEVKIYLTASLEERAKRRSIDYERGKLKSDFSVVRSEIEKRDHQDITRKESPLSVAPGAHVIDSGNLPIEEVVNRIIEIVSALN